MKAWHDFIMETGPIIISCIALLMAMHVPKRIAKKQNQIAVFDKLFHAYSQLLNMKEFANTIGKAVTADDLIVWQPLQEKIICFFKSTFEYKISSSDELEQFFAILRSRETEVRMISLLISKNIKEKESCDAMISAIYDSLRKIVSSVMSKEKSAKETRESVKNFIESTDAFFNSYTSTIENLLMIQKVKWTLV